MSDTLGQDLIDAMEEAVAYRKGKLKLEERVVKVAPRSVDVYAIRTRNAQKRLRRCWKAPER